MNSLTVRFDGKGSLPRSDLVNLPGELGLGVDVEADRVGAAAANKPTYARFANGLRVALPPAAENLEQGRLVEQGTHDQLLATKGLYFYLTSQQLDL